MESRPLVRVPVPPGPEGPARLLPELAHALDGTGPAIAPVPTVSATCSDDYVRSVLEAVRPDGPPLESPEVAAVVATSGSTGRPRGVLLTASSLNALTEAVNGVDPRWVLALPVTSVGGLLVLVRALASGREPAVVPSIGGAGPFTPGAFAAAVDEAERSGGSVHVSLVPAQVARLLADDDGVRALRRCERILVGGAALRASLRELAAHEGIDLTSTYGSTETGGGCVFDGEPQPGVTVQLDDGRIVVGGPTIAAGYRGEPALTEACFTADGFRTADIGRFDDRGRLVVVGRIDDVVVVNGVNVALGAIEEVLNDHPDIESAAVVTVTSPDGEPALHGFVVVRDHAARACESARARVVERLGPPARPVLHEVAALPHLAHGKVDRQLLSSWAREFGQAT